MTLYLVLALLLAAFSAMLLWPVRKNKRFCAGVCAAFTLAAFGLYGWVGAPEIIPLLAKRELRLAELKENIARNLQAIKIDNKDIPPWVGLGGDFMETGQYDAAAKAFKQAVLLSGGNPKLILAYARAMIAADDGKVGDHAKKSLEMVLLQEPANPDARYFLAVRALQDGRQQEAMKEMKALYRSLPEGSPLKEMIDRQIGRK